MVAGRGREERSEGTALHKKRTRSFPLALFLGLFLHGRPDFDFSIYTAGLNL